MIQPIGIMGAMPEEIEGIVALLNNKTAFTSGMRTYYSGTINEQPVVVVFSRWGKVAAATTVSTLIHQYQISELLFTGVAGAIHPTVNIGDIVLGQHLVQHDMDASPLMPKFEIPLLGKTYFEADANRLQKASTIIPSLLEQQVLNTYIADETLSIFGIHTPKLHIGTIASGDQFFAQQSQKTNLHLALPQVLCVEMEGAAVAQVCYEYHIPCTIIRTISDAADEQSPIDFPKFIEAIASKYAAAIVEQWFAVA
jgi:adenosylhomocysteine nucleosidase